MLRNTMKVRGCDWHDGFLPAYDEDAGYQDRNHSSIELQLNQLGCL